MQKQIILKRRIDIKIKIKINNLCFKYIMDNEYKYIGNIANILQNQISVIQTNNGNETTTKKINTRDIIVTNDNLNINTGNSQINGLVIKGTDGTLSKILTVDIINKLVDLIQGSYNLNITFGTNTIIHGQIIDLTLVQTQPNVSFNGTINKYYSFIIIDPDAYSYDNQILKYYLHWMAINVPSSIINSQYDVVHFYPPTPPINSGLHRYYCILFEQINGLITLNLTDRISYLNRSNFDVNRFIQIYNLSNKASIIFQTQSIV